MVKFNVGDKVEHILSGEWLLVLVADEDNQKALCRKKDLGKVVVHMWEIKKVR